MILMRAPKLLQGPTRSGASGTYYFTSPKAFWATWSSPATGVTWTSLANAPSLIS